MSLKCKAVKSQIMSDYIRPLQPDGGAIPSQQYLARHYRVSVGTLDRALQELVAENIVEKRHGSGTYVLPGRPNPKITVGIYFLLMRESDSRINLFSYTLYDAIVELLTAGGYNCRHYFDSRPEPMLDTPLPQLQEDIQTKKISSLLVIKSDIHFDAWLDELSIPRFSINRDFGWGTATYNVMQTGYDAAQLLIDQGCRSVELLSVYDKEWEMAKDAIGFLRPFRAGMTNALLAAGLPPPQLWLTPEVYPESIRNLHYSYDDALRGYELCKVLFKMAKPDGIIVFTDVMAIGVGRALDELGLVPGRDIHVVVLGNREIHFPELDRFICYNLSIAEIAEAFIALIQAALDGGPPEARLISRAVEK